MTAILPLKFQGLEIKPHVFLCFSVKMDQIDNFPKFKVQVTTFFSKVTIGSFKFMC
jgi:hypothetical protein